MLGCPNASARGRGARGGPSAWGCHSCPGKFDTVLASPVGVRLDASQIKVKLKTGWPQKVDAKGSCDLLERTVFSLEWVSGAEGGKRSVEEGHAEDTLPHRSHTGIWDKGCWGG